MEDSSTTDSSPIRSFHRRAHSVQFAGLHHQVQCRCDMETRSFFERGYRSFVPQVQTNSCWRARQWLQLLDKRADGLFEDLVSSPIDSPQFLESAMKIDLDLGRTYPEEVYFSQSIGKAALRRCLLAFSKYDMELGYVQGMNFIMGALLWHASEADAFWLFVKLIEDYELRDTYQPLLPGLNKHCQILQLLILECLPRISRQLAEFRISCELYAAEWCFSLFANVIPVTAMHCFLDSFFTKGWTFFYGFVIAYLDSVESTILEAEEALELLVAMKAGLRRSSVFSWDPWTKLGRKASSFGIDEEYIKFLHMYFNSDTGRFNVT